MWVYRTVLYRNAARLCWVRVGVMLIVGCCSRGVWLGLAGR